MTSTLPQKIKIWMNDKVGIHKPSWYDNHGGDEPLRPRGLDDSSHRPQDNNLWKTYNDGFVDYVHEI